MSFCLNAWSRSMLRRGVARFSWFGNKCNAMSDYRAVSIAASASLDGSHHEGNGSWPDVNACMFGVCPPDAECSKDSRP